MNRILTNPAVLTVTMSHVDSYKAALSSGIVRRQCRFFRIAIRRAFSQQRGIIER